MLAAGGPPQLYPWQAQCLCSRGVLAGRSLVYCAPTSGGKSLVAEILMLRRLALTGRPALLVLPFVALCAEKAAHLKRLLGPLGKEVQHFYGSVHTGAALGPSTGVVVCTIEKANILVNRLLEDQALGLLSSVTIDELHMVGDPERGYQLELLLTKLRYTGATAWEEAGTGDHGQRHQHQGDNAMVHPSLQATLTEEGVQIVGMSATLPNVDVVAKWLGAQLFHTDFRPVPLWQLVKVGRELQDAAGAVVRTLSPPEGWQGRDPELVAWLVQETVAGGHSALVFCASRSACERTARLLTSLLEVPERQLPVKMADSGDPTATATSTAQQQQRPTRASLCAQLQQLSGAGASADLPAVLAKGVAFHHAGLDSEEREIVEVAYRCGAVSVLCATSTLAAGVNLPARRVIFRHAYVGQPGNLIDATRYRQMAGRAGRAGIDSEGEAVLLAGPGAPAPRLRALMAAGAEPVESCLSEESKGMKRAMLEVVATGAVAQPADVDRYIRCTLLAAMNSFATVATATKAALKWLGHRDQAFIYWDEPSQSYQPTSFGKAVLASSLPPELCMHVRSDLARARESFVLTTELHLTYLCVPPTESLAPRWDVLYALLNKLQAADRSVAQKVGLNFSHVQARSRGLGAATSAAAAPGCSGLADTRQQAAAEQERICRRFWGALILTDLLQEATLPQVCSKYELARGAAQGLQERAARHASMVAAFCERLGWHELEALVAKFQARVLHGVRPEIMSLCEVPYVKAATARLLYKAGLRTPEAVSAVAGAEVIASILTTGSPAVARDPVAAALLRQQASRIVRAAREVVSRRAREMRQQATEALALLDAAAKQDTMQDQPGAEHSSVVASEVQHSHIAGNNGAANSAAAGGGGGGGGGGGNSSITGGVHSAASDSVALQVFQAYAAPSTTVHSGNGSDSEGPGQGDQVEEGAPEESFAADGIPPEQELAADAWEFGGRVGAHQLTQPRQVAAMRQLLEGDSRYARFAFAFDYRSCSQGGAPAGAAPPRLAVPLGPSASRNGAHSAGDAPQRELHGAAPQGHTQTHCSSGGKTRIDGVAVSWRDGQAFYVPLQGAVPGVAAEVAALFACPSLEKITWDLKGQMAALAQVMGPAALGAPWDRQSTRAGHHRDPPQQQQQHLSNPPHDEGSSSTVIALRDPLVDLRIAAFLATPDDERLSDATAACGSSKALRPYTAEGLAAARMGPVAAAAATHDMPSESHGPLAVCRRAALVRRTYTLVRSTLEAQGALAALHRVEMPLVRVLAAIEASGVALDVSALLREEPTLLRRLAELQAAANELAGGECNLSSPADCSRVLYEVLQLPVPPSAGALQGGGGWSTRSEAMQELAAACPQCRLPAIITEYRSLSKLLSGFIDLLRGHAALAAPQPGRPGQDLRRLCGSFNQTRAATGRLSMDEPNLQNVPRPLIFDVTCTPGSVAAASGRDRRRHDCNLRRAFSAPPGHVLLSADYRQLELRLMAHFSGDEALLTMLSDGHTDPFELLAARWLHGRGQGQAGVTKEERAQAKKLAYGIMYGMGAARLARELDVRGPGAEAQARQAASTFLESLPGVQRWVHHVEGSCRREACVRTLAGRSRRLAHILASGRSGAAREASARAERQAVNTVCQGSAADVAKAAMVAVAAALAALVPPARLVLQIHDEFLVEVAEGGWAQAAAAVRSAMEGAWPGLTVPLRVRLAVGPSWGELVELPE